MTDGRKYSLTVASFIDSRKMEDTLLIGRVIKSDGSSIPILPKYVKPTDAVAAALRELLIPVGIRRLPGEGRPGISRRARSGRSGERSSSAEPSMSST